MSSFNVKPRTCSTNLDHQASERSIELENWARSIVSRYEDLRHRGNPDDVGRIFGSIYLEALEILKP